MKFPHGFLVTVERPGGSDRYGNPLPGTTHTIEKCARDQTQTIESDNGVMVVNTSERLLCDDSAADVKADDTLILPDGTRWQVTGDIDRPISPFTGWNPGCVIPIKRASGSNSSQE